MSYPAVLLINRAWNLSGIVARNLQTVTGGQVSDGLFLLNELLEFKASDLSKIPYWTRYEFNLIQGEEEYFIDNLYQIETLTFNIGPVRYPITITNRTKYFGDGRVDNIESIPYEGHLEREKGGSTIRLYYLPMDDYVANITGKFALTDVTLNQDMSLTYDGFYLAYLRYALAEVMCNEYDIAFSPEKKQYLTTMEKKLSYVSPPDLTMQKVSFLGKRNPFNWAQANIGRGYVP